MRTEMLGHVVDYGEYLAGTERGKKEIDAMCFDWLNWAIRYYTTGDEALGTTATVWWHQLSPTKPMFPHTARFVFYAGVDFE
jgi:hypothetical protein